MVNSVFSVIQMKHPGKHKVHCRSQLLTCEQQLYCKQLTVVLVLWQVFSACTLKELCPEDKQKVAKLVKQVCLPLCSA